MASDTVSNCLEEGCRNNVKSSNPTYPYCYAHARKRVVEYGDDYQEAAHDPIWQSIPRTVAPRIRGGESGFAPERVPRMASLYTEYVGLRPDIAEPVLYGTLEWKGDDDLLVPDVAAKRFEDSVVGLRDSLRSNGVSIDCMSNVRLYGCTRSIYEWRRVANDHGWKKDVNREAWRDVLVIDYDSVRPIVVDPIISAYAPVKNRAESVVGKFDDGETPYTEEVWIDSLDAYLRNPYISWHEHEKIEWHERGRF